MLTTLMLQKIYQKSNSQPLSLLGPCFADNLSRCIKLGVLNASSKSVADLRDKNDISKGTFYQVHVFVWV